MRIKKITRTTLVGKRHKTIGKNARLDDHGIESRETLVRIFTDEGVEGIGIIRRFPDEQLRRRAKEMLGRDPLDFFSSEVGVTVREFEFPLWDLVGKIWGLPVWKLIGNGESYRDHIPAYDGSLYFCDLLYPEKGLKRVEEEVIDSLERGFKAIKVKIGRGHKWMSPEEGFRRDAEVVKRVREIGGPDTSIMIDANNGYDRHGAERLMNEIGPCKIFFVEEMFPEDVQEGLKFKAFLSEQGFETMVADGEGMGQVSDFIPFLRSGVLDVVQADMRHIGLTEYKVLAQLAKEHHAYAAPHNWGSRFALFVILHLGKAVPNFLCAEEDPVRFDPYVMAGMTFRDGGYLLDETPGFGIGLDREAYEAYERNEETLSNF